MVAVHPRRRDRERYRRSGGYGDDRSTSSVDEFKALAGERKHDFGEFETKRISTRQKTSTEAIAATTGTNPSTSAIKAIRNTSMDGSFYFEGRSEPAEDTLSFAAKGREENDVTREDSPNVVDHYMESDSDYESDVVHQHDLHSDETKEHDNNTHATPTRTATQNLPDSLSVSKNKTSDANHQETKTTMTQKSILRPRGKGFFGIGDVSLRSTKSSFRSRSSSFRSSEAGSVSVASSHLQPIARIRVVVTDDSISSSAKKSVNDAASATVADESHAPTLPSRAYGDDITDAGTALISANRGYHPRPVKSSPEELSEASSINLSGSYSSYSTSGGSQTDSRDSDTHQTHTKTRGESSRPYSVQEASRAITAPLEQTYTIDSNGKRKEKRTPLSAGKSKIRQGLKKGLQRSVRNMKYLFTGKLFVKGFYHMKKFGGHIVNVVRKPFSLGSKGRSLKQPGGSTLESRNTLIDEELAHSLLNTNIEDESSVARASRYVATGRELLNEAAKMKNKNPAVCSILTRKAHTYAYAARQMARKALIDRKAAAVDGNSMHLSKNVLNEIVDDDQVAATREENNVWKKKLEELQLFSFEDFMPSCFSACGTGCGSSDSTLEVDLALDILDKLSEEDEQAGKLVLSTSKSLRSIENVESSTSHAVANNSLLSKVESAAVETNGSTLGTDGFSVEKSRTVAIRELVSGLQSFYEADQTINGNSTTIASTYQEERSLFTKETSVPGGQSVEMRTIKNDDTFQWSKLTQSLFNAEEDDDHDDDATENHKEERIESTRKDEPHPIDEKKYHSDASCAYTESLKDDGSSYSHSYASDGASYTSGTRVSIASTSGRSSSKASTTKQSKATTEPICQTQEEVTAVDSLFLFDSSTHSRSSRSRFEKWSLRRKGKF